ncbi:hypothetical protein LCGC14_0941860 [marine sediment metagenome]|uniref:3'-phosphate/5'-hydroxy nucleic acid ligase n=1 Tax=marine sediment metagenome TaxID=412755 RepID=A0A0F9P5X6_9ZZZZ
MHIVGTHDDKTIAQLHDVGARAARTAIMADGHLGYWMPIGGVAAFRDWVAPAGVGYDIACGNCAIKTDMKMDDLASKDLSKIADDIQSHISFGVGRTNLTKDAPTDHKLFDDERWEVLPQAANKSALRELARAQLGTVGSGNHYVDVFKDEDDVIWIGVHFGSRGFGHKICTGFMAIAAGAHWSGRAVDNSANPGALMHLNTWGGQAYWSMMELAGDYAYAGREWVARKVVEILGANEVKMIHNHHNFAWKEEHMDELGDNMEEFIVVRKGATPAFPGQYGFVGGSMGDESVILRGHTNGDFEEQERMLFSTVHGAGRVLGRAAAKKGAAILDDRGIPTGKRDTSTMVTQDMMDEWVGKAGIYLRGGGVDESPHVYRRLPDVLEAQGNTIQVLTTLTPLIVVMAGAHEYDPYKD